MDQEIKTWLYDVLNAIIEIEGFFVGTTATFEIYQKDLKTKRAVERNIEIIAEAFQRILKKENTDADLIITNLIKPMLKEWLDNNLPRLVEKVIAEELKKLIPKK